MPNTFAQSTYRAHTFRARTFAGLGENLPADVAASDSARWDVAIRDESGNANTASTSMGINIHDLGDLVTVSAAFTDPENDDAPTDPAVVKLSIRDPSGTVATYTYDVGADIVRDDEGEYHANIDADEPGQWFYRWWSTGEGQAAREQRFRVRQAQAV